MSLLEWNRQHGMSQRYNRPIRASRQPQTRARLRVKNEKSDNDAYQRRIVSNVTVRTDIESWYRAGTCLVRWGLGTVNNWRRPFWNNRTALHIGWVWITTWFVRKQRAFTRRRINQNLRLWVQTRPFGQRNFLFQPRLRHYVSTIKLLYRHVQGTALSWHWAAR